jgi:hypothetical protein
MANDYATILIGSFEVCDGPTFPGLAPAVAPLPAPTSATGWKGSFAASPLGRASS